MCTFVAMGGGGGLNNQVQPNLLLSYHFAQINLHFRYENNTYKLLVIRQNDNEVSVDVMDVHAADKP